MVDGQLPPGGEAPVAAQADLQDLTPAPVTEADLPAGALDPETLLEAPDSQALTADERSAAVEAAAVRPDTQQPYEAPVDPAAAAERTAAVEAAAVRPESPLTTEVTAPVTEVASEKAETNEASFDREKVLAKLDETQRALDELRATFEGVAAEDPLKNSLPEESAAVEPEVAQAAAASVADLAPEHPEISSLRLQVKQPSAEDSYADAHDKAVAEPSAPAYPVAPRPMAGEVIDTTGQPLQAGAITELPAFTPPTTETVVDRPGNTDLIDDPVAAIAPTAPYEVPATIPPEVRTETTSTTPKDNVEVNPPPAE